MNFSAHWDVFTRLWVSLNSPNVTVNRWAQSFTKSTKGRLSSGKRSLIWNNNCGCACACVWSLAMRACGTLIKNYPTTVVRNVVVCCTQQPCFSACLVYWIHCTTNIHTDEWCTVCAARNKRWSSLCESCCASGRCIEDEACRCQSVDKEINRCTYGVVTMKIHSSIIVT